MRILSKRQVALVATAALALTGAATAVAPAASATGKSTVTIANTKPRWLAHAQKNSITPNAAAPMSVRVYLQPNGGTAALQAKVASLSDPGSADYGHWLSNTQYFAAYSPTNSTVAAVRSYLASHGLTVGAVAAHNTYVTASGSKSQLDSAFGVTLGSYRHDGQTVTAPSSAVVLPGSIGSSVLTVTGLDTTTTALTHDSKTDTTPPPGFVNGKPCNINYGTVLATYQADYKTKLPKFDDTTLPFAVCGYTGPSFRAAYEQNSALTGKGVTVGIVDAYRWQKIASDANTYAEQNGDGSYVPGQLTENLPPSYTNQALCGPSGWSGEETLDVEAVHAMAPDANIRYYAGTSCLDADLTDATQRVVDEDKVQLVSNSYGDAGEGNTSDAQVAADQQVYLQGAAEGISFLFSSGDSGDELADTGIKQADYPATSPYVTAVGGTSTAISGGSLLFQTGWGTDKYTLSSDGKSWSPIGYLYGAGGGYSSLFNRPTYQNGVVPASAPAGRAVPDVAMDADPTTGMLIGQTQTFPDGVHYGQYRIGGTSLASPLFAGMTALAVQNNKGKGFGLLNPKLYKSAKQFTDVKPTPSQLGAVRVDYANGIDPSAGLIYSVRTYDQDSSLATAKGWDPVTGIGVPNPTYLTDGKTASTSSGSGSSGSGAGGSTVSKPVADGRPAAG